MKFSFIRLGIGVYEKTLSPLVCWFFWQHFFYKTLASDTNRWMGIPILQNPLDLEIIQETIYDLRPELMIETGTHSGGSSYYYAQLFDLLGKGKIITIDVKNKRKVDHPRVEYLLASSVAPTAIQRVREVVTTVKGPVMVILDSNHSEGHVSQELEAYAPFVTPGSYVLVQDGVIDTQIMWRSYRPGPLPAIKAFLKRHPEFEVDHYKCTKFIVTEHPMGWLKRRA